MRASRSRSWPSPSIVPASGLGSVTRLDQERVVTVLGDAAPGANANAVLAQVQAELAPMIAELPAGYTDRVHRRRTRSRTRASASSRRRC